MDEYEEQVLAMLDDLAAADAIPDSIKMMNNAAIRDLALNGFPKPILAAMLFDERV